MTGIKFTEIKRGWGLIALIIVLMAGCGPSQKEMMARDHLDRARVAHAQAQADQNVATYAQAPLTEADLAIKAGQQASNYKEIDHQAYLAEKKTQIARAITEAKMAENEREAQSREKDLLVLQTKGQVDAKSRELKGAQREVEAGNVALVQTEKEKMGAEAQTRQAEKEVNIKSRELRESKTEIAAGAAQLAQTEKEKMDAEAQTRQAEKEKAETELFISELSKLMVKQTDRGVIVTLGDVLFATGQANLSLKADDNIDKLVAFMNKYPNVNVLVEGYTDSVGKENMNLALSRKRADAVRAKLIDKGINPDRITTKGYGKGYATADNATKDGRQQNRRVEVLLLSEGARPEDRLRK
jgi:outer membrane protein OmpA-like peptidoglycan-associated protein